MDWKYILSLSPEELTEQNVEDLYSTLAWYDFENEVFESDKYVAVLKLSQEIMKFKAEQVQMLLTELDEIARKQGEDEAKRLESDADARSSKSRIRSPASADYSDLEQKYVDLKSKYKQQSKITEKFKRNAEDLKNKLTDVEQERDQLQIELQRALQDGSQSDISESIKDQHKELVETLHHKNKQIGSLLTDIEEVESENTVLKEKLAQVRDELAEATKQLEKLNSETSAYKVKQKESSATLEELKLENSALRGEINDLSEERESLERQIESFTEEINARVDEWKRILDEKDEEIKKLKADVKITASTSSSQSAENMPKPLHTTSLHKLIYEKDVQIGELQKQLQDATGEMRETTDTLKLAAREKDRFERKISQLAALNTDLKKQLKAVNERCQQLQDDVAFLEENCVKKDKDIKELISGLKEDESKLELAKILAQREELKAECRLNEKRMTQLVKTSNKLQEAFDNVCLENQAMRDKLGLREDENINVGDILIKYKKQKKALQNAHVQLSKLEEENINLKLKVQVLSRKSASLSKQILKVGRTPNCEYTAAVETENHLNETDNELKVLAEENEALRKGMHEILESLHKKNESASNEIQSATLEQLLRALDVKHISGWYHPAMRLQAELHALQGVNSELREQLRQNKDELMKYKHALPSSVKEEPAFFSSPKALLKLLPKRVSKAEEEILGNLNQHLLNVLEIHKQTEKDNDLMKQKINSYKSDFIQLKQDIDSLTLNSQEQLQLLNQKMQSLEDDNKSLQEAASISEAKLKECIVQLNLSSDEKARAEHAIELAVNIAVLNRKCLFFEKQESSLREEVNNLRNNLLTAENDLKHKSSEMSAMEKQLRSKLIIAENELKGKVDAAVFEETQQALDKLDVKYKMLLQDFNHLSSENSLEVEILNKTAQAFKKDKQELQQQLAAALMKFHIESSSENADELTKKLAETEVNEITERQRADHINNLYELVKEQLQKSEDRFKEFEAYNKEILHKNLLLQESLKEFQDRVLNYVDLPTFKNIQTDYLVTLKENEALSVENEKLKGDVKLLTSNLRSHKLWSNSQEYEFLSLKHQIVDLQATTDDKTVIARLSTDVVNARLSESRLEQIVKGLAEDLEELQSRYNKNEKCLLEEKQRHTEVKEEYEKKIRIIQETIRKQREQYFGCVPLSIQERFTGKLKQAALDKKLAFKNRCNAQKFESECSILKDQLQIELQFLEELKRKENDSVNHFLKNQEERKIVKLENLKCKRLIEFQGEQLNQLHQRINSQDEHITEMEEELLQLYQKSPDISPTAQPPTPKEMQMPADIITKIKLFSSKQTQTLECAQDEPIDNSDAQDILYKLQLQLMEKENEVLGKDNTIGQLKSKITELEMNISLFRQQLGDKQSQIMFYEKHILELRGKVEKAEKAIPEENARDSNALVKMNEETVALKATISNLQMVLNDKEEAILKYQTLLKKDRDEHSLAAARMQEELRRLQNALAEQQKAYIKAQETAKTEPHPGRAAIEQYILQVHQLESHTAELHTTVSSLTSQLQASRQEAVRWRTLANDRLETLELLRKDLEEQHQNEIISYKQDSEKWRQEVTELKQLLCKFKTETSQVMPDLNKILKEKDNKIHELSVLLRQARGEAKRHTEKDKDPYLSPKFNELFAVKELLRKEYDLLKSRYEQLLNKEKTARDEIRELKSQLMKRPALSSARSDKTDKTIKEQLQRKITGLEKEITELKENLDKQVTINENHKSKMTEDFEKWKKQKHWQQMAEKLKIKLKEKEDAFEKLHQTCSGYRILIERLEREKHGLEAKLKLFKSSNPLTIHSHMEVLRNENIKLLSEVEVLNSKLEMSQHHSGGLGAAMLQEKLESQERKIAILELAAKGTVEVRAELERLQNTVANLQKRNLCLEAENLELKLDLEKSAGDVPHMKEQIQHLENYVEVLKSENEGLKSSGNTERPEAAMPADCKKVAELEKTVFVLKRVVEKLQAENKRLLSGSRLCTLSDRSGSVDQLRRDFNRIKQQYGASVQKAARLEQELNQANSRIKALESKGAPNSFSALSEELCEVRSQLAQKTALLDKVKTLLQRAAAKERGLQEEVDDLRRQLMRSSAPERES